MRKPKLRKKSTWKSEGRQKKLSSAYREAVKEIAEEKIAEIKTMVRQTLDSIREREETIALQTAILAEHRRDLEDLKRGRLDAIKKRRQTVKKHGGYQLPVSPIDPDRIGAITSSLSNASGSYLVSSLNPAWVGGVTTATANDWASQFQTKQPS